MTATKNTPAPAPAKPEVPAPAKAEVPAPTPTPDHAAPIGPLTELEALRAELAAVKAQIPVRPAKPTTARDYVREVDLAIIIAAGDAVEATVPEKFRAEVKQLVANQLHHLSTPKAGWPSTTLPTPDRSEWR